MLVAACGKSNLVGVGGGRSVKERCDIRACGVVVSYDEDITCGSANRGYQVDGNRGRSYLDGDAVTIGRLGRQIQSTGPITRVVNIQVKTHIVLHRAVFGNSVSKSGFPV